MPSQNMINAVNSHLSPHKNRTKFTKEAIYVNPIILRLTEESEVKLDELTFQLVQKDRKRKNEKRGNRKQADKAMKVTDS